LGINKLWKNFVPRLVVVVEPEPREEHCGSVGLGGLAPIPRYRCWLSPPGTYRYVEKLEHFDQSIVCKGDEKLIIVRGPRKVKDG
jgi:hypothetical protein